LLLNVYSVRQHLLTIASFCEELCKKDPDAGRTEKLTILEEILEMEVEYNGTENSVGVVFVDRRITALALYNYFKEREKAMDQDLPWPRVADSRWSRRPKIRPSFNFVSGDQSPSDENIDMLNLDNFASSVTNDYLEQIDNSMIRQVVLGTLPDSINIQDLAAIQDDEPMESSTAQRFKTIRSDMLVRQSNQIFKYLDKRHHFTLEEEELLHEEWLHEMKKSAEVLDGLRSRRTNVLIATSVVEEGVDVEACSFVIVFDHLKSTKGYVQMRGRARQKNARFYVFHDTSPMSMTSYISLQDAFSIDRHLQHFIEQRPTNVPVPKPPPRKKIFEEFFSDEYKAVMEGSYCVGMSLLDCIFLIPIYTN
jgi:ERCC4-related helicase